MSSNKKGVHITTRADDRWNVTRDNAQRASSVHDTQAAATSAGRETARFEITRNGRGVYYEYFYCLGRQVQKNGCDFVATQVPIIERLVEDHWRTVQLRDDIIRDIRQIVLDHLGRVLPARDKQRSEAEARLTQLKRESDKLLQAYYADAIDVDALRAEQARIAATRALVERSLDQADVAVEQLSASFERCCELLANAHEHYLANDETGRRDLNQSVFRRIYVLDDEVVGSDFTPVFKRLLDDDLAATLNREVPKEPSTKLHASNLVLIEERGAMPEADVYESGIFRAKARRAQPTTLTTLRERPHGIFPSESKNPGPTED